MFDNVSVLIVEDELFTALELAEEVIERGGRVLGPATSVRSALAILESETPDIAVLDAMLPDNDVSPVSTLLSAKRVPFVVYTGSLPTAKVAEGVPVLQKPLPARRVMETLAELLNRKAA